MTDLIAVPLAEGFEETEAVAIVDVLRRAEIETVTVSLADRQVTGGHDIRVTADRTWEELDEDAVTALVLPGGMPGTTNLLADSRVLALVRRLHGAGRLTAAVCAAPWVLAEAGILTPETEFTCHPSTRGQLQELAPSDGPRVLRSGTILTSQGPGTALEFALEVVAVLRGPEVADRLAEAMLVPRGG